MVALMPPCWYAAPAGCVLPSGAPSVQDPAAGRVLPSEPCSGLLWAPAAHVSTTRRCHYPHPLCRIRQQDLSFPHPPPGDDRAALEAAGVSPMPPAAQEDGELEAAAEPASPAVQQQGCTAGQAQTQVQAQAEWRDQPAGGRAERKAPPGVVASSSKELGEPLLELDARPAALSTLTAKPGQQAKQRVDVPALLPPHAPGTPSHATGASAAARSGGAQLSKEAAGL